MRFPLIQLAFKIAKYRKSITRLLLASIITTTALLTALSIVGQSYQEIQKKKDLYLYGFFDAVLFDNQDNQINSINNIISSDQTGSMQLIGTIETGDKQSISFGTVDESFIKSASFELSKGRFPQTNSEIAIEQSAYDRYYSSTDIGQTIKLQVVTRSSNGTQQTEMSFKLVGIIENYSQLWNQLAKISRTDSNLYFTLDAFILPDAISSEVLSIKKAYSIYFLNGQNSERILNDLMNRLKNPYSLMNNPYKADYLVSSQDQSFLYYLVPIMMILTVMLILNAYSQNLIERKRLSRTLMTIGMQTSQLFKVQLFYALLMTLIALPIGLLLGLFLSYISLLFISQSYNVPFVFNYSPSMLGFSAVIIAVSSIVASLVPAINSSSEKWHSDSPEKKFRQKALNTQNKISVEKFTRKRLQHPSLTIAMRILKKHRFRSITTGLTIIAAMTLFAFLMANIKGEMDLLNRNIGSDFSIYYSGNAEQSNISSETIAAIGRLSGVKKIEAKKLDYTYQLYLESETPNYFLASGAAQPFDSYFSKQISADLDTAIQFGVTGISADMLQELAPTIVSGSIDLETLKAGQGAILSLGTLHQLDDGQIYTGNIDELPPGMKIVRDFEYDGSIKAGDRVSFYKEDQNGTIKKTDLIIVAISNAAVNQLYVYEDAMKTLGLCDHYGTCDIYIDKSAELRSLKNELFSIIQSNPMIAIYDKSEAADRQKSQIMALYSQNYLLITLLAVVGMFSLIILSISQVYNQQRQIGLYLVAGMSSRQILILFCLIGSIGSIGAVGIGYLVSVLFVVYFYFSSVQKSFNLSLSEYFPIIPILGSGILVVLINSISLIYPLRKMSNQSPNTIIRMNEENKLM